MNAPTQKTDWLTPEALEYLRHVEYDFHVRAFGEEMARVKFLPLTWRKGVKFDKPALGVTP